MKNSVQLKKKAWFADEQVTYDFPDNWDLNIFSLKDSELLTTKEIKRNIDHPIGSEKIQTLSRQGMKVLIICDDISRPTRTDLVLPILIDSLLEAGVRRDDISILIASGTHTVMTSYEIELKIGKEVINHFQVHTHNCKRENVFIGRTSRGTPVYVNKRVVESDLVIGVGGLYPHNPAGFSGGAKLILGVCSISTILHFHRKRKGSEIGGDIHNEFRLDMLEAARLAHLDFIVNMIINGDRELIDVVAGDTDEAFLEGICRARSLLGVPGPDSESYDLVIADVYPFDSTYAFMRKGWWPVKNVKQECYKLIIAAMPKGIGGHLIYSVPGDSKMNKIKLLFYEFKTFGISDFISKNIRFKLALVFRKITSKILLRKRNHKYTGESDYIKTDNHSLEFSILHHTEGEVKAQLYLLPHRLFDNMDQYINYLNGITGQRPLRVAIYKNSSLTFPVNNQDTLSI